MPIGPGAHRGRFLFHALRRELPATLDGRTEGHQRQPRQAVVPVPRLPDQIERLAGVALREDLPGLIQQTTGGCARSARRCRPFAIAAIAPAGHRRLRSPRGSKLLEGREPENAPTVEGQDEAHDMVAEIPWRPPRRSRPRRCPPPHRHPVPDAGDEDIEQVDTGPLCRTTSGRGVRAGRTPALPLGRPSMMPFQRWLVTCDQARVELPAGAFPISRSSV